MTLTAQASKDHKKKTSRIKKLITWSRTSFLITFAFLLMLTDPIRPVFAQTISANPQNTQNAENAQNISSQEAFLFLNRLTWGANPSSAAQLKSLGVDAYLQQQLQVRNGALSKLPDAVQNQIDAMTISTMPFTTMMFALEEQREKAYELKDSDNQLNKAYRQELYRINEEAASRSLLRALYSDRQLYEQMNWFWMNHFNISNKKGNVRAMLGDFEESAIRPYALGNFRQLLRATMLHPAMLRYLDNEHNAVGKINENYARELMELHTMGVDSGYTQNDVQELARVLTGLGIRLKPENPGARAPQKSGILRYGLTEFNPRRHDFGDKKILGITIKGDGISELDRIVNILAKQPATAHFISQKLALYFVSDTPSTELVNAMAKSFLQNDAEITAVLKTMFASAEFKDSLGTKFKDPLHYVISSVRLAYDPYTYINTYDTTDATNATNASQIIVNTQPILKWINQLGQEMNGHQTPDGYAMKESAWSSSAQMTSRFDVAKIIARGSPMLFKSKDSDQISNKITNKITNKNNINNDAMLAIPKPHLANTDYVKLMSQQFSDNTQNILQHVQSPQEWNTLFLASPEMMRR